MAKTQIFTSTDNDQDDDYKPVTGTDLGGGKRGLDLNLSGSVSVLPVTTGTTDHFNGTATTSPANVPASAGNAITSVMVKNTNSANINLQVSFDGGSTFYDIERGEVLSGEPKGSLTQFIVQTASSTATYQSIVNRVA